MSRNDSKHRTVETEPPEPTEGEPARLPYEPPRIVRRVEVRDVTLFTGIGVNAVGLTASG